MSPYSHKRKAVDYTKTGGFSLLEMIIYIVILVFMLVIIINVMVSLTRSQRIIKTSRNIENSAVNILERFTREIRQADDIDIASSVFDSDPGKLVLSGTDINGDPRTVEFYVSSGTVFFKENDVDIGAISQSDAKVTTVVFRNFSGVEAKGIKAEITIESGTSTHYRSADFYSSATLR